MAHFLALKNAAWRAAPTRVTPCHHTRSYLSRARRETANTNKSSHMEEGRAHEEVAPAPAPQGRRLARPVFLAAVALALLSFAAIVSGAEISSALEQTRDMS